MLKHIAYCLAASIALAVAFSCASMPATHDTNCLPVPAPECTPGAYSTVEIDTSRVQADGFKYHIDLLPKPVNSNANDNAITFFPDGRAALSAERYGRGGTEALHHGGDSSVEKQRMMLTKLQPDLQFDALREFEGTDSFETVGACCYCPADQRLYFTAKARNDDADDYDIYSGKVNLASGTLQLTSILLVSAISTLHRFDAQPAVSPDGLMIVFASDREGGYGGVDLWISIRNSIEAPWGEPKAIPPPVNSTCDEITPSFSRDGKTLFFASNGHTTAGGYDIFSGTRSGGEWKNVRNIGLPINSKADEVFPYQLSDSQFFYSSSQHIDLEGMNILVMRRTKVNQTVPNAAVAVLPDSIELRGNVKLPTIRDSSRPDVFVRDVALDTEIARKPTDSTGAYTFNVLKGRQYDVGADVKDKFYDVHRVDLRNPTDSVVIVPSLSIPDTLVIRINFPFNDDSKPYDFIYDDAGARSDTKWQSSLDLLAHSIKESSKSLTKVVLYGHTDSLGTDEYNLGLAKRRAMFVAKELQRRGISSRLLVIVSKGRTMPLERRPGEDDETYRLRCRRVEFVKVFGKETPR